MKKIIILVGYARSGVTILNKCFASDPRLICLSEINSRFLCPTEFSRPSMQLKSWYDVEIPESSILNEIDIIKKYSDVTEKTLFIRDWSFGSFVPLKYNNYSPTKTLNTIDDLEKKYDLTTFCLVRNPIDVWLSMKNSPKTFHDRELEYLCVFIKDIIERKIPIFKYEDFCNNPKETLNKIYELAGIERSPEISLSNNVTGDNATPEASRGINKDQILKLKRRPLSKENKLFLIEKTKAIDIMKLLNYDLGELKIV